jgi:FAD:protein FMN transferase
MKVFQHHAVAMGTRFNLVIPELDPLRETTISEGLDEILNNEENKLSRHKEESLISQINRQAYHRPVVIDEDIADIFDVCAYYHSKTDGAFDPAILDVILHENDSGTKDFSGWKNIIRNGNEVRFTRPHMGIDAGGFGKGRALEKILAFLHSEGISSAFISFGESSISAVGSHPLGNEWKIEVPNPFTGKPLELSLYAQSVSISGLGRNSSTPDKSGNAHIYSPAKNRFVTEDQMALVISDSPLQAEILSTALIAADNQQKKAIFENFPSVVVYECMNSDWQRIHAD